MVPTDREFPVSDKFPMRVLPSVLETWVKGAVSRFAVLAGIDERLDPTAQLVAIMMRLDYTPKREHLAGGHRLDPDIEVGDYGLARIASKHVSAEMLIDLDAELELAETDSRVEVLTMRDGNGNLVDGAVYVSDNGQMVYTDHSTEKPDMSKDRGEGWGSW